MHADGRSGSYRGFHSQGTDRVGGVGVRRHLQQGTWYPVHNIANNASVGTSNAQGTEKEWFGRTRDIELYRKYSLKWPRCNGLRDC